MQRKNLRRTFALSMPKPQGDHRLGTKIVCKPLSTHIHSAWKDFTLVSEIKHKEMKCAEAET